MALRSKLATGLLLVCAACSGVPTSDLISEGEACRVDYYGRQPLTIVNQSYHERDPDLTKQQLVSRVSDQVMTALVADFESLGFFEGALKSSSAPPGEFIAVSLSEGTWTLPKTALRQRWGTFIKGVSFVWSNGDRLVGQASHGQGRDLQAEKRRLEEKNRKLRTRLGERR